MALLFPSNPARDDEYTDGNSVIWICTNSTTSGDTYTSWKKATADGGGGVTVHNDLTSIQGGSATERYHLTLDHSNAVTGASTPSGSNVFATITDLSGFTSDHDSLSGIDGGGANDYQHLTTTEYAAVTNATGATSLNPFATVNEIPANGDFDHDSLGTLSGGAAGEYNHIINTDYAAITGAASASGANVFATVADVVPYNHPSYNGDDIDIDTGPLTGAVVVSDIDIVMDSDPLGHVLNASASVATRTLTLANLGYTGDTDAKNDQTKSEIDALGINATHLGGTALQKLQQANAISDSDVTNFDTITEFGLTGTIKCTTGAPTAAVDTWWNIINTRHNGGGQSQGMQITSLMSAGGDELYWRRENITWSDWYEIYHQGSPIRKSGYHQRTDVSTSGSYALNYSDGDMQQFTATGNISPTFSFFVSGQVCSFIVDAINWGAYSVTWPAGTKFADGVPPTLTVSGKDRLLILKDKDNVYSVHVVDKDVK